MVVVVDAQEAAQHTPASNSTRRFGKLRAVSYKVSYGPVGEKSDPGYIKSEGDKEEREIAQTSRRGKLASSREEMKTNWWRFLTATVLFLFLC